MNTHIVWLLLGLVGTCAFAEPDAYESQDVQKLALTLRQSLESNTADSTQIADVVRGYAQLPRQSIKADELLEMKYMVSHWKGIMTERLLQKFQANPETEARVTVLTDIDVLKPKLEARHIEILLQGVSPSQFIRKHVIMRQLIFKRIAEYGRSEPARAALEESGITEALLLAGPPPIEKIKPYKGGPLRGLDWINGRKPVEGMDQYEFIDNHTVRFRGQELKSGDIFVADLALAHDGVLTSFMEKRSNFTHAALFVVLQVDGKRIPAVLEMHEKGNRIVPLANFLGNHTYYAEAFRVPTPPENWGDKLSAEVVKMMQGEKIVYDFQARDIPADGQLPENQKCATCTTLPDILYKRTGVNLPWDKSKVVEGAHRNLDYLGMTGVRSLLLPTDVAMSGMTQVGVFDNNQLRENMARELMVGHASVRGTPGHAFANGDFDMKLLPLANSMFRNLEVSIGQSNSIVGTVGRGLFGFQTDEVPKTAPPSTVAFYLISNDTVGPISQELASTCGGLAARIGANKALSLRTMQESVDVGSVVSSLVKRSGIHGWYRPRAN